MVNPAKIDIPLIATIVSAAILIFVGGMITGASIVVLIWSPP